MALTELQKEIVAGILERKSNEELAEKLHYSKGKIKKELEKIYKFFKIKGDAASKRQALVMEVTKIELANLMM